MPEKDGELPHRQQRRYEKAERRVEQAGRKLEKAQEKIPAKRRAHLEKQYDSESGRVRRHLRFEKEAVPENAKPALPKRVGGAAVRTAQTTALLKAHQKLREAERDNTG
ncbi:MAG: peptidase M24, partial [Dysosmobacter sp.]|nr:peptidase M24 [Dysosmobacter sp.]